LNVHVELYSVDVAAVRREFSIPIITARDCALKPFDAAHEETPARRRAVGREGSTTSRLRPASGGFTRRSTAHKASNGACRSTSQAKTNHRTHARQRLHAHGEF
jgi:hypothetical protein